MDEEIGRFVFFEFSPRTEEKSGDLGSRTPSLNARANRCVKQRFKLR